MKEDLALLDLTREGVAVVTLNRPSLHNAFNQDLIERLDDIFTDLGRADGVRAVLLDAKGSSFSAGADLDWMRRAAGFTERENQEDAEALLGALRRKEYPVFLASATSDSLFHVQVGPFLSQKEAEAMRARLSGDGYNAILKK